MYPHQALVLDKKEKILCNGALISENFVLTAAQCSNRRKENAATYVKLGPSLSPSNTIQIEILYNLVHPQYRDHSQNYDIALFQLVRDVEITQYISPICLELIDRQNEEVKTVDAVDVQTNSITKIEMETMPNSHCRESFYQHHNEFDLDFDTMVCANATTKQNLCQDRVGE